MLALFNALPPAAPRDEPAAPESHMKHISRNTRGTRWATSCPWPPASFARPDSDPDALRHGGTLRMHAAQATLEAVLRQRLPAGLRPGGDAGRGIAPPPLLADWRVEGSPPRAAHGDDDLMGAAQDRAASGEPTRSARTESAAMIPGPSGGWSATAPSWRGAPPGIDPGLHALFRIF